MTRFRPPTRLLPSLGLAICFLPAGCGSTPATAGSTASDAAAGTDTSAEGGQPADAAQGGFDATDGGEAEAGDGATVGSGACPGSGDPVACDDGTGSLGTKAACPLSAEPGASASLHLRVSGSMFTTLGACLYVTPSSCSSAKGDVLEFSGGDGTGPGAALNGLGEKAPYCLRLVSVAWDSNWADDGTTSGGPAGMGGNVLAASRRPQALIEWVHSYLRTSSTTPLCGSGGSAGSSELQVMHNNGAELLDHVQLTSATPYARFDNGCDPATPQEGTNVVCSGLPPATEPQYSFLYGASNPGAVHLVQSDTHDPNCDADGGVQSPAEQAALQAMSLVTSGFTPITLETTSLSAFMCATVPNATQGQAVYVFGVNADLANLDAGLYTGLISLNLATSFYGCPAGSACMPHVVCNSACATEDFGETMVDKVALAADMRDNCVIRH
jgi:hypothetical protein